MSLTRQHMAFGAAVRLLREQRHISQTELARRIGTSQPTLSLLEQGQRNPGLGTVFRICDELDIPMTALAQAVDAELERP